MLRVSVMQSIIEKRSVDQCLDNCNELTSNDSGYRLMKKLRFSTEHNVVYFFYEGDHGKVHQDCKECSARGEFY